MLHHSEGLWLVLIQIQVRVVMHASACVSQCEFDVVALTKSLSVPTHNSYIHAF